MRHVAAHDFAVPFVFEGSGPDLVMERVDGPTMLAELMAGRLDPALCGLTLAELANRLHTIPGLGSIVPFDRVIHLDLHPDNVILAARGPVVIDWRNATDGTPGLDNALTVVIIVQAVLAGIVDAGLADPARKLLRAFIDGIDHRIDDHLDEAIAMRRDNVTMSVAEVEVLAEAPTFLASLM